MCQKRIVTVVIMHSKNEMYDHIFNKKPTRASVGDHKTFFTFVSKYPCLGNVMVLKSLSVARCKAHVIAIEAIL